METRAVIQLRTSMQTKRALADAAAARGKTLTAFIIEAASAEAAKSPPEANIDEVPTRVRSLLATAKSGGAHGYEVAGFAFASSVVVAIPTDEEEEGIAEWLAAAYPKVVELIPRRRISLFCRGIICFVESINRSEVMAAGDADSISLDCVSLQ